MIKITHLCCFKILIKCLYFPGMYIHTMMNTDFKTMLPIDRRRQRGDKGTIS